MFDELLTDVECCSAEKRRTEYQSRNHISPLYGCIHNLKHTALRGLNEKF